MNELMPLFFRVVCCIFVVAGPILAQEVPIKVLRGGGRHDESRASRSEIPLHGKVVAVNPGEFIDNAAPAAPADEVVSSLSSISNSNQQEALFSAHRDDPQPMAIDNCIAPPCYPTVKKSPISNSNSPDALDSSLVVAQLADPDPVASDNCIVPPCFPTAKGSPNSNSVAPAAFHSSLVVAQPADPLWVPAKVVMPKQCLVPPCYPTAKRSPCISTDYAPCAVPTSYENEALRATVDELQGELQASQVSTYNRDLKRAMASGEEKTQVEELRHRLQGARQHLGSEHTARIEALERAHKAEMRRLEVELRRNATLEAAAAYQSGFNAHGSIDDQAKQSSDNATRDAVAQAGSSSAVIEDSQRDTKAYQVGLEVGALFSGSAADPHRDWAGPLAVTFPPVAVPH